jgi:hypothetical protein
VAAFGLAALPWLALHHAVNYATGGTFQPANAVPDYFLWPGCPFDPHNMTGVWNHTVGHFLAYAADLLVGQRGFLNHNLPLLLALPAIVVLLARRTKELPEILFVGFWCGGTWLAYAVTSTNHSGLCCSIRWLVPLLAPAYFALAVFLRQHPAWRRDFVLLSAWGALFAGMMWLEGPWRPWMKQRLVYYWLLQAVALASWAGYCLRQRRLARQTAAGEPERLADAA